MKRGEERERLAEYLGISADQLAEELAADGATLATVAEAHGKSRDDLKAFLSESAKARLDEAVADGDLTQEQADEMAARLGEHLDTLIDAPAGRGPGRHGFPFKFRHPHGDDHGDDTPDAEPQGGGTSGRSES
jgi:hypothetical protein